MTINKPLGELQSGRYNKMIEQGLNLDEIVDIATAVLADVEFENKINEGSYHLVIALKDLKIDYVMRDD